MFYDLVVLYFLENSFDFQPRKKQIGILINILKCYITPLFDVNNTILEFLDDQQGLVVQVWFDVATQAVQRLYIIVWLARHGVVHECQRVLQRYKLQYRTLQQLLGLHVALEYFLLFFRHEQLIRLFRKLSKQIALRLFASG